jgi:hypothetical protein
MQANPKFVIAIPQTPALQFPKRPHFNSPNARTSIPQTPAPQLPKRPISSLWKIPLPTTRDLLQVVLKWP